MMHDCGWTGKARTVARVLCGLTILLVVGCAEERPPIPADRPVQSSESPIPEVPEIIQNASVAGTWRITCEAGAADCHGFKIQFAQGGDIVDYEGSGLDGPAKGMGSVRNGKLHFVVSGMVEFDGKLDETGMSATGELKGHGADGTATTATATAVRGNPLCDGPDAHRMRSCR